MTVSLSDEDRCYLGQCTNNICAVITTPTPTTQPPIVTTTPVAPVQETCFNEQQCCGPWAARGECTRNPPYMNSWCRASCGVCTPTTYDLNTECSNRHVMCPTWAGRGECRNNAAWMSENCRMACNLCGQTRAQVCNTGRDVRILNDNLVDIDNDDNYYGTNNKSKYEIPVICK
ncbi:shTK domain protein [Oesophagostomum dentatum]|uniref:ShTK domain protein n=1 Tax=Oesophagostomum dentatum TaxID=61180 RepID=A0A0B1SHZ4_OESDE|nr:shTK domain protein [Oesophagostomum dentatum]